jgi:hypothetical protein
MTQFSEDQTAESEHHIVPRKAREEVFLDEFIGVVIRVMRLDGFECVIAHDLPPEERVTFNLQGYNPTDDTEYNFEGQGPSMGHALRTILDQIADKFGLDRESIL